MAIVRVEMGKRPQPERESIIAGITDVLVAHGSPRENTHVILYEIDYDVWAKGGLPYSVRRERVPQPDGEQASPAAATGADQHGASGS